jgi:hypothetical protein
MGILMTGVFANVRETLEACGKSEFVVVSVPQLVPGLRWQISELDPYVASRGTGEIRATDLIELLWQLPFIAYARADAMAKSSGVATALVQTGL